GAGVLDSHALAPEPVGPSHTGDERPRAPAAHHGPRARDRESGGRRPHDPRGRRPPRTLGAHRRRPPLSHLRQAGHRGPGPARAADADAPCYLTVLGNESSTLPYSATLDGGILGATKVLMG